MLASVGVYVKLVCSFGGVILIARPQFIFGGLPANVPSEVDMSGKRMISVMSARRSVRLADVVLIGFIEQVWLASWERPVAVSSVYALCSSLGIQLILVCVFPTDTILRAVGKRAHALHVLSTFCSQCILASTIGCVSRLEACFASSDGPTRGAHHLPA